MCKYLIEYRINKKGAECFRSTDWAAICTKFAALSEKARTASLLSVQSRYVPLDRLGIPLTAGNGQPLWSTWRANQLPR